MPWAKTGHTYVAYLLGLLVVVQFLLAGLGTVGGESIEPHKAVGSAFQLLSLVLLVLALLASYRGPLLGMTIGLFLLAALQSLWIRIEDPLWIRSIHVLMALAIAMILREIVGRIVKPAT